jgi:hypothetical protein
LLLTTSSIVAAQTPTPSPKKPDDDVVRVYTELVQTDVMVFDKQGHFVNGLTKDNFELRVDGKPRPIESFELIAAGSDEESQLAAARGATTINLKGSSRLSSKRRWAKTIRPRSPRQLVKSVFCNNSPTIERY